MKVRNILRAIAVAAVLLYALGASAQTSILYDGVILDRPNVHDGNPAHILWNGTHYIWWGSKGTSGDVIYMSKKAGSLGAGGWAAPTKVFGKGQTGGWADNHTNDPSIIGGPFSFSGKNYALAMYYTADRNCGGCNNAIGVAYSKDGSIWNSVTLPVVVPGTNPTTLYGAGMSGAAKDPGSGAILHAYFDATYPNIRLNSSTDARTISPIPGNITQLASMGRFGDGQGPDIAYHAPSGYWYAAIKCTDQFGQYDGEVRLLKSTQPGTLLGAWTLLGFIDRSVTGTIHNAQPGLGKNLDGSLYVDGSGWAYVFFITGQPAPNITVRAVSQARFLP
jgi:hypothetical protein